MAHTEAEQAALKGIQPAFGQNDLFVVFHA
jgi:hypothetical protein